jgi:hypothetical protein
MSKGTEMAPHFRKAVEEIDGDIAGLQRDIEKLQGARAAIVDLYGGCGAALAVDAPPAGRTKAKRKYKKRTRVASGAAATPPLAAAPGGEAAAGGGGRQQSADSVALLAVARKMPEPISAKTLAIAGTVDYKFASNRILAWVSYGWLKKSGRGEFRRSKTFPEQAP